MLLAGSTRTRRNLACAGIGADDHGGGRGAAHREGQGPRRHPPQLHAPGALMNSSHEDEAVDHNLTVSEAVALRASAH